jgi:hypothetical protein
MSNIACKVRYTNIEMESVNTKKTRLVFGFLSKLKNGPIIIKIRPNIEEIKNRGKRNAFSQKSGILYFVFYSITILYVI